MSDYLPTSPLPLEARGSIDQALENAARSVNQEIINSMGFGPFYFGAKGCLPRPTIDVIGRVAGLAFEPSATGDNDPRARAIEVGAVVGLTVGCRALGDDMTRVRYIDQYTRRLRGLTRHFTNPDSTQHGTMNEIIRDAGQDLGLRLNSMELTHLYHPFDGSDELLRNTAYRRALGFTVMDAMHMMTYDAIRGSRPIEAAAAVSIIEGAEFIRNKPGELDVAMITDGPPPDC